MALMPLAACVFFLGCYYSGRLVRVFLGLLRNTGSPVETRKSEHPEVQLMSLAEWLSGSPHNKTGR